MSTLTERVNQPDPHDLMRINDLPETAPPEHPAPWREEGRGNGHAHLYDANNVCVAHVQAWDEAEYKLLYEKLSKINEGCVIAFVYQFYCSDCCQGFSAAVPRAVNEIPELERSICLCVVAAHGGKKPIWPVGDPSEEEAHKMERETVHCPKGSDHHIEFVWKTGTNSD